MRLSVAASNHTLRGYTARLLHSVTTTPHPRDWLPTNSVVLSSHIRLFLTTSS